MSRSEAEIEALWVAVFGEPPPVKADPGLLIDVLLRCSPPLPPYRIGDGAADRPEEDPQGPE
ncbi:MAG: hypothetical protein JO127_08550 [Caulobacteraceae bacterium]|nr:hypothetical protein [Caulobacteraceae bacterium]